MSDENQIPLNLGDEPIKETNTPDPIVEIAEEGTPVVETKENDVQNALEKLQKKLKKEEKLRKKAEQEAYEASVRANQASSDVENSNLTLVTTAIDTVKRDQEILKANLRDSMSIGDYDKAAEIQEVMSMNSAKLLQLEQGFQEMRSRPKIEPVAPPQRAGDMIDDIASRVTPLSAKWIKQNRDHLEDPRAIRMMGRAHEDAVDMGIRPESDEYFRFVENRLGIGREDTRQHQETADDTDSPLSEAASSSTRRQSPPAAPVSRTGSAPGTRPNVVRLTPAQAEAAKISGLSEVEYYKLMIQERNRAH
jgi:ribosomal protein S21